MANILKTQPFTLLFALFWHPFYTFFKHIFLQCGLPVIGRHLHLLETAALLLFILWLTSLAITLHCGSQLSTDPLGAYLASHGGLYDGYLLACICCLLLYTLISNWQLFLGQKETKASKRSISWQGVAYDLTVRNADQAQACRRLRPQRSNLDLSQTDSKFASLHLLFNQLKNQLTLAHLDLSKLCLPRHQLTVFTFLSLKSRKRCLQFQFASNLLAHLLPALSVVLIGLTVHLILGTLATQRSFPPLGWLLLLMDLILLWNYGLLLYRHVPLVLYFSLITSLAIVCHLKAAHRLLAFLRVNARSRTTLALNPWNTLLLRNFLAEHAQICALLDATNRQIISLALFATFILNAPTNIYLVYRLIYLQLLLSEFIIILAITLGQILCIACAVVPLIWVNGSIYRTGKYLPGSSAVCPSRGNMSTSQVQV